MVLEKTSMRPEGVGSGFATGSSRKRRSSPPSSSSCGRVRLPASQNCAKSGAGSPFYEQGPYMKSEYQVEAFIGWYIDRMREHVE